MAPRGHVQRAHMNYFTDVMQQVTWDVHQTVLDNGEVPRQWHRIARRRGAREKVRVTLRVEEDVVKFFRAMGKGYQERMNDVLRAWMHGRLAGVIDGPEAEDLTVALVQQYARPRAGDVAMNLKGIVRRDDGRLYSLDEERYLAEEDLTAEAEVVEAAVEAAAAQAVVFSTARGAG
tara:strand:+ start:41306 stop:41833 length:528 start_codon:yes stop_codon:yes gene_type:complete